MDRLKIMLINKSSMKQIHILLAEAFILVNIDVKFNKNLLLNISLIASHRFKIVVRKYF